MYLKSYTKLIKYSNMSEKVDSRKRLLLLTTKIPSDVSFAVSFLFCIHTLPHDILSKLLI